MKVFLVDKLQAAHAALYSCACLVMQSGCLLVVTCRLHQAKANSSAPQPSAKTTTPPAKANATSPAKKETGTAQKGRTAAAGAATNNTAKTGQGARAGVGQFTFENPDAPPAGRSNQAGTWVSGMGRRLM